MRTTHEGLQALESVFRKAFLSIERFSGCPQKIVKKKRLFINIKEKKIIKI